MNVHNVDNRCFGYAILSALEPQASNPQRAAKYDHLFRIYGLDQIRYPVEVTDIDAIEEILHIQINIFSFYDDEGRSRFPVRVNKKPYVKVVDLLHWNDHYAWIKSFPSFMADLVQKHTLHWCRKCLGHFKVEQSRSIHKRYCNGIEYCGQIFILPEPSRKAKFEYIPFGIAAPFVVYADFYALLKPTNKVQEERGHNSFDYEEQVPSPLRS